jgi:AcrR family transcriptional regulator
MNDRRQRDKERTIQEVLTAATRLFSKNGLHGTSIRDIEKASGVSKGLILYHFGSKENLYASVQDQLNQKYIAWMAAQRETSKDLLDSIEKGIGGSLSYLKANNEFRRIILWSYLEGQQRTTDLDKRFTASLITAMRTGQQENLVHDDVKAFILPFIIRGAIDYWIRGESLREGLLAEDKQEEEISDKDFIEVLVKLILK